MATARARAAFALVSRTADIALQGRVDREAHHMLPTGLTARRGTRPTARYSSTDSSARAQSPVHLPHQDWVHESVLHRQRAQSVAVFNSCQSPGLTHKLGSRA
jgi:hypothetical protein